jgi:hypothetical protein
LRGEAVTTERRAKILQAITALYQIQFSELHTELIAALEHMIDEKENKY